MKPCGSLLVGLYCLASSIVLHMVMRSKVLRCVLTSFFEIYFFWISLQLVKLGKNSADRSQKIILIWVFLILPPTLPFWMNFLGNNSLLTVFVQQIYTLSDCIPVFHMPYIVSLIRNWTCNCNLIFGNVYHTLSSDSLYIFQRLEFGGHLLHNQNAHLYLVRVVT